MKIAYVQYYSNGDYWSDACADAAEGLLSLGYTIRPFVNDTLHTLPISKNTIVKGSIRQTRIALNILKVPQPLNMDIPQSLKSFANRKIWNSTLGEVKRRVLETGESVFVKPLYYQKAFNGHVLSIDLNYSYKLIHGWITSHIQNEFPVLAQEVVEFKGEWRAYVLHGKILGIYYYNGAYTNGYNRSYGAAPRKEQVQKIVDVFKKQPSAFAIDIGYIHNPLTGKRKLSVIEVNEGFSCGNYGLPSKKYAMMVEARWFEMMKTRNYEAKKK